MTQLTKRPFGKAKSGEAVDCFTLTNQRGFSAEILTYGGSLRALKVPVCNELRDVVLGFDRLEDYQRQNKYIGAIVGRVANRIGGAGFTLDGTHYPLAANSGPNCLHGGICGFNQAIWQAETAQGALTLRHTSPDGEEGFPGKLEVAVTYALLDDGLSITYRAKTDKPTLVNLTNHSYFNLNGCGAGTIERHLVQICADLVTECDENSLPSGVLFPVDGTPFDLRTPKLLGAGLASKHPQVLLGNGYDHNFVLKSDWDAALRPAALVSAGNLQMACNTTQPGVQLYTANFLEGELGKGGKPYPRRSGLCLETQNWPDAVHHPHFPSPVLRPGETYCQTTVYRFSEERI